MPAAAEILKKVFEEGVESVSKEDLAKLFASSKTKLSRIDLRPEEFIEQGWNPKRGHLSGVAYSDEPGLYWASRPKDLKYFRTGGYLESVAKRPLEELEVEGIKRPGASEITTFAGGGAPPHTTEGVDFINREWPVHDFSETVQKRPGNVLARYGDKYKIIGLAAALGLGGYAASQPHEAHAGLFSDILKATMEGAAKRTAETTGKELAMEAGTSEARLVGKTLTVEGVEKTVSGVRRVSGNPNIRLVLFEDGTHTPYPTKTVHHLCNEFGKQWKMEELASKKPKEQFDQALKSLKYHTDRQRPMTQGMRDAYKQFHDDQMKSLGVPVEEMVHIDAPIKAYIPKKYADILEQAGIIKLTKGTK
jgi:hypothetical protein